MLCGGYGEEDVSSELKKKNFASVVYGCKGTACGCDGRYTILRECCTIAGASTYAILSFIPFRG